MDRIAKMEKIFKPRSVAFVGASNNMGKWGGIILHNLISGGYEGDVFPVNPGETEVQGIAACPSVESIPHEIDLVILSVPVKAVLPALKQAVDKGVPACIIITAGYAELGEEGRALQEEILATAGQGEMVLVGPNSQGISVPPSKLHPWMPMLKPLPGSISIASQSGNVSTVLAEKLGEFGFGCSKAVSAGNCADLGFADYLEYFRKDESTRVALLYVEGVGPSFFEAARRCAAEKPVVVLKSGRTGPGVKAVSSHTGVLAGSDEIFSAACRQAGLVRADSLEEAAMISASLVKSPSAKGPRVGVVTGGGGYGVMAADEIERQGLEVAVLSEATIGRLKEMLPPWWAPNNPVDMVAGLGYAGPREIVPVLMEAPEVDAVIVLGIGWVYSMTDPAGAQIDINNPHPQVKRYIDWDMENSQIMADYFFKYGKPLLMTSSLAHLAVRRGYPSLTSLLEKGIMIYPAIPDAVKAAKALYERGRRQ